MDTSPDYNTPPSEHNESSISKIPKILPHERVFPIQIGTELFKLSGASLSSDGTRLLPTCSRQLQLCNPSTLLAMDWWLHCPASCTDCGVSRLKPWN